MSTTWQKRESFSPLTGDGHIDVYLNPTHRNVGCGAEGHDADCLCDVDLGKTEGIVWDNPPSHVYNVETVEDLIRAGADIWLEYDVGKVPVNGRKEDDRRPGVGAAALSPEHMATLVDLIRGKAGYNAIVAMPNYNTLTTQEYTFLLRALDMSTVQAKKKIPTQRCIELHEQGMCPADIVRALRVELRRSIHPSTIAALLRRNGVVPHVGNPGRRKREPSS